MEIPTAYQIVDYRKLDAFKKKTFSNYQKSDVLSAFQKSLNNGNTDEACHWMIELLISGYIEEIWLKIMISISKLVNIANPLLPQYIYHRYNQYIRAIQHREYEDDNIIKTRNNQELRNHLSEIVAILTTSPKNPIDKTPKITNEDFRLDNFKIHLIAVEYKLVDKIVLNEDPPEVKMIANEISFHLNEKFSSFEKCNYWLHWLLEWEKITSKKCGKFQCGYRAKTYIKPQFYHDFIWLIWDIIFQELVSRQQPTKLYNQIKALYEMYCYQFSSSNKRKKIYLVQHSFILLTMEINWDIPVISNYPLTVQTSANINILFLEFKKIEQSNAPQQHNLPYDLATYDNYLIPINNSNNDDSKNNNPKNNNPKNKKNNKKKDIDVKSLQKLDRVSQIQNMIYNLH